MNLAIRFDIDTTQCMRSGVPVLLALGEKYSVPFTFYANMGRSIDVQSILSIFSKKTHTDTPKTSKLSVLEKLGFFSVLHTLLLNPRVGSSCPALLKQLVDEGHELGLHGGRNHATWQRSAQLWTEAKIKAEVEWGVKQFQAANLPLPNTFSSPGFNSPGKLSLILKELGFNLMADLCVSDKGPLDQNSVNEDGTIINVNTNVSGQPGSIGFFEWCKAKKLTNQNMLEIVLEKLNKETSAILYDHPAYISNGGATQLEYLITELQKRKVKFSSISRLIQPDE